MKLDPKEVGGLWVPANPEHAKLGWSYDFEQTERIARAAYDSTGYDATMEVVEFVMAEADRRHRDALTTERAAHAETKRERDEARKMRAEANNEWRIAFNNLTMKCEAAEARLAEALKALEPFAEIAGEAWADGSGWTNAACQNDRICDWFGPSAFHTARRVREGGKVDG